MDRIILTADEISSIQVLLSELASQYTSAEDPRFINANSDGYSGCCVIKRNLFRGDHYHEFCVQ